MHGDVRLEGQPSHITGLVCSCAELEGEGEEEGGEREGGGMDELGSTGCNYAPCSAAAASAARRGPVSCSTIRAYLSQHTCTK